MFTCSVHVYMPIAARLNFCKGLLTSYQVFWRQISCATEYSSLAGGWFGSQNLAIKEPEIQHCESRLHSLLLQMKKKEHEGFEDRRGFLKIRLMFLMCHHHGSHFQPFLVLFLDYQDACCFEYVDTARRHTCVRGTRGSDRD